MIVIESYTILILYYIHTAQGRVEKCSLDFTSSSSKCSTIRLPQPKSGDTFGMSLEASETPVVCVFDTFNTRE